MTLKGAIPYEEGFLRERLKDKELAVAYLNECLEGEEDLSLFLLALRHVIEANEVKMTNVAKQSGLSRENLYKILSKKGNPELKSLKAILDTLGYKIAIQG